MYETRIHLNRNLPVFPSLSFLTIPFYSPRKIRLQMVHLFTSLGSGASPRSNRLQHGVYHVPCLSDSRNAKVYWSKVSWLRATELALERRGKRDFSTTEGAGKKREY